MDQFGDFSQNINRIDGYLSDVRRSWTDETAMTYDTINDNMKKFTCNISEHYNNAKQGYEMMRANYDDQEFESTLNQLTAKVQALD